MSTMIPEPDGDGWLIGSATEEQFGVQVGPTVLVNVHPAERCQGRACVVHNPSDHHMRTWVLNWRGDRRLMERLCPKHGVGHPDPDDVAWQVSQGYGGGVHGCCGCCVEQEVAA